MMRRYPALLALIVLSACVMTSPRHVAEKYCRLSTVEQRDDKAMQGILSRDLRGLWKTAMTMNDTWARLNPGEKPPLGDGIQTQAYPDFAPGCELVEPFAGQGEKRTVTVHRSFTDHAAPDWEDELDLISEDGSWVIDDIHFGPHYKDSLRAGLKDVLAQ